MSLLQVMNIGVAQFPTGARIVSGAKTTRATVLAETADLKCGIGSIYMSTAGKQYVRVAAAGVEADWERTTTSAAD